MKFEILYKLYKMEVSSFENDPIYGLTYIIEPEEWLKQHCTYTNYNKYEIVKSNYGNEEWKEIKYRAAKFIQSWWKWKKQVK